MQLLRARMCLAFVPVRCPFTFMRQNLQITTFFLLVPLSYHPLAHTSVEGSDASVRATQWASAGNWAMRCMKHCHHHLSLTAPSFPQCSVLKRRRRHPPLSFFSFSFFSCSRSWAVNRAKGGR